MRHHLSGRQLSRNSSHRHALLRNMSVSLLRHETIRTTTPKAKELRRVVEPLITLAKKDSEANRRVAFSRLRDSEVVTKLFEDLGPRFKAAVVTTDFPLAIDKPIDFGLQDFCTKCKKCARECPGGAISDGEKVMHNGYEKWPLEVKKCTSMRVGNQFGSGCGTCIKVCPWNKPNTPFHQMINWTMRNVPFTRNFAVTDDDLMGYGKANSGRKWWFDLEEKNGVLRIPRQPGEKDGVVCDHEVD